MRRDKMAATFGPTYWRRQWCAGVRSARGPVAALGAVFGGLGVASVLDQRRADSLFWGLDPDPNVS